MAGEGFLPMREGGVCGGRGGGGSGLAHGRGFRGGVRVGYIILTLARKSILMMVVAGWEVGVSELIFSTDGHG